MPKGSHSRAYHRHFEGYVEKEVCGSNGKTSIQRIYTGDYYVSSLSPSSHTLHKATVGAAYLLSVLLYFLSALRPTLINTWYVSLPQALTLISLLWLSMPAFYRITAKSEMTVRIYRDASLWLQRISLCTSVCLAFSAISIWVYVGIHTHPQPMRELGTSLGFVLGSATVLLLFWKERKLEYEMKPSSHVRPEKAVLIRY